MAAKKQRKPKRKTTELRAASQKFLFKEFSHKLIKSSKLKLAPSNNLSLPLVTFLGLAREGKRPLKQIVHRFYRYDIWNWFGFNPQTVAQNRRLTFFPLLVLALPWLNVSGHASLGFFWVHLSDKIKTKSRGKVFWPQIYSCNKEIKPILNKLWKLITSKALYKRQSFAHPKKSLRVSINRKRTCCPEGVFLSLLSRECPNRTTESLRQKYWNWNCGERSWSIPVSLRRCAGQTHFSRHESLSRFSLLAAIVVSARRRAAILAYLLCFSACLRPGL